MQTAQNDINFHTIVLSMPCPAVHTIIAIKLELDSKMHACIVGWVAHLASLLFLLLLSIIRGYKCPLSCHLVDDHRWLHH